MRYSCTELRANNYLNTNCRVMQRNPHNATVNTNRIQNRITYYDALYYNSTLFIAIKMHFYTCKRELQYCEKEFTNTQFVVLHQRLLMISIIASAILTQI